jgi:hypothetical protein
MVADSPKAKHAGGRPSTYKPEYCKQIIEYFTIPQTRQIIKEYVTKSGTIIKEPIEKPNDLPFLEAFARSIGSNIQTLHMWCKRHREFHEAFTHAKELQKEFMVRNGIAGLYPPAAYAFTAKNITDMRDRTEIDAALSITSWIMALEPKEKRKSIANTAIEQKK